MLCAVADGVWVEWFRAAHAFALTNDGKFITLDEKKSTEGILVKVWNKLRPHWIGEQSRGLLNSIPELSEFQKLEEEKKGKREEP
jgi:hypothetical protein